MTSNAIPAAVHGRTAIMRVACWTAKTFRRGIIRQKRPGNPSLRDLDRARLGLGRDDRLSDVRALHLHRQIK
jgi:hypothetical protein